MIPEIQDMSPVRRGRGSCSFPKTEWGYKVRQHLKFHAGKRGKENKLWRSLIHRFLGRTMTASAAHVSVWSLELVLRILWPW